MPRRQKERQLLTLLCVRGRLFPESVFSRPRQRPLCGCVGAFFFETGAQIAPNEDAYGKAYLSYDDDSGRSP